MMPRFAESDLDCEMVFDRYLGIDDTLNALQEALVALAPRWVPNLRVWRGPRDQRPINTQQKGALSTAVMACAAERGPTYQALVDQHGAPPFGRLAGSAELRGSGPDLVVVVSVDTMVASPLGARWQLGNRIALQVRRPRVGRVPSGTWLFEAFGCLCANLLPAWGWAGHPGEYWAKVMSDPPRVEAVGRDFGQFLPGVFWLNFFGSRYRELIGDDRLRSAPAEKVMPLDGGTLIEIAGDPPSWDSPEYAANEQRIRSHLGTELFFSKGEPERLTIAPDWDA